ncbi:C4-dicarboxylate ABC transporter permease [Oceanobacillus oncorhynchi subsp. incaldanensis]|uniref:tripartite tricarboxylate transporter permease n=1 Tax=Oceanobacillus oncorhynchi TaxID=545501 RepID=UPI001B052478|nr:tripartite tricarboxylate transporter permease [Oceanobacillus oncorhynchi]GIO20256.1 C4-dicarboxylate ABC transporter permease [Oceanobacillus oncorhynchi subsp. incaldanensis]
MDNILLAFETVFTFTSVMAIFLGVLIGIIMGVLPGLTVTMGVALLFPVTFTFDGISGILMLLGIYIGAVYGGSIPAILLNTPGTPASAATMIEGNPMVKRGEAGRALKISTTASGVGGIISNIVLILIAPVLAGLALNFSAPEYFALAIFGISIIVSISTESVVKGLIGGVIGLSIATVGIDSVTGYTRFTFDSTYLMGGISFIPILVGLFAFSQTLLSIEETYGQTIKKTKMKIKGFFPAKADLKATRGHMLRSGLIGTFIGTVPGTGGDIAAYVSYNESKRFAKKPEEFGKGSIEGLSAPEAGNNAVTGGAMIPMTTLGIPGDSVTAIILGALMVQGIQPGPLLFEEQPDQVYGLFVGLLIANVFMMILGLIGIRYFAKVVDVPKYILSPIIFILCFVGAFAINNSLIDVFVMVGAGIIGYFLLKLKFSMSPIILGLILGPMIESNMRRSLIMSEGDISIFFTRPISAAFLLLTILALFLPPLISYIKKRKAY